MTPELSALAVAVVEAARVYCAFPDVGVMADPQDYVEGEECWFRLKDAVMKLEEALSTPAINERDITWGQVKAGDEVLSLKGEWHEVRSMHLTNMRDPLVHIELVNDRVINKKPSVEVRVRRVSRPDEVDAIKALKDAFGSVTLLGSSQ